MTRREVCDVHEIHDVHKKYCRGIDRFDWDLVRSCFHENARLDHGSYAGPLQGFLDYAQEILLDFECTTHFIGNQLVEFTGEGEARMESYTRAYHRIPEADGAAARDWVMNVRYIDELRREPSGWVIVSRLMVTDSARTDDVGASTDPAHHRNWGSRGRQDPSYP